MTKIKSSFIRMKVDNHRFRWGVYRLMTPRTATWISLFLSIWTWGCGTDPVVGSWKGAKQNLSFHSDGTLRSLESVAVAGINAASCETAGHIDQVQECATGGWTPQGKGYQLQTSDLVVADGGSRINCTCTHSYLYAEIADANLVIYDHEGGQTLDRMSR